MVEKNCLMKFGQFFSDIKVIIILKATIPCKVANE